MRNQKILDANFVRSWHFCFLEKFKKMLPNDKMLKSPPRRTTEDDQGIPIIIGTRSQKIIH